MAFFHYTFLGCDMSIPITPTSIENITEITLYDGKYEDFFITNDVISEESPEIQSNWDENTVLHAKFNGNTNAGTFGVDMDMVTDILVKKREKGTNKWITIARKSIIDSVKPEEFNFSGVDFFSRAKHTYEYAVVSYANGIEGNYNVVDVPVDFDCISISEKDTSYSTIAEVGGCDFTRKGNGTTQELLNSRYPVKYKYGMSNYDTGTVSGYWVKGCCDLDINGALDYMSELKEFLFDGEAKILKHPDGRIWLVTVNEDEGISDESQEYVLEKRIVSFSVTEIGDYMSEKDLYHLGLSDVSQEYWSQVYV